MFGMVIGENGKQDVDEGLLFEVEEEEEVTEVEEIGVIGESKPGQYQPSSEEAFGLEMMVVVCKGMFCGGENVDSGEEMEEEEEVVDGVIGEKYVYCGVL